MSPTVQITAQKHFRLVGKVDPPPPVAALPTRPHRCDNCLGTNPWPPFGDETPWPRLTASGTAHVMNIACHLCPQS